jgi:hypothetical protein
MAKKQIVEALEPVSVPAMDRPSVILAWFMDSIKFEQVEYEENITMECSVCGDSICEVESGDTLRVLFNTALAHGCQT